jgi:hypothetical protein
MKLNLLAAVAAFVAMSASAQADITRTFDIEASDFTLAFGSDTPAPADPVHLNFTVTFDPSTVTDGTSTGLTINSFTLPYASTFSYDGSSILIVATYAFVDGWDNPPDSYGIAIYNPADASPYTSAFQQSTSSGGYWDSSTISLSAGPITTVPEPSTWAMMLLGFAGLGYAGYRRARRGTVLAA